METYRVCQLMKDSRFEGFLMVRGAEKKTDKNGRDYVDLNLGDRTGEINAKIWNWDSLQGLPESGKPVLVRGQVQEYNGRLQMKIERWRPLNPEDSLDLAELVPAAPRTPEDMLAEIRETVKGFTSENLRKLTEEMLNMAGERLSWFPAAQRMHHAERSGLLHHTTDMLRLAKAAMEVYPWMNRDLLLAGVILHDLGKLEELKSDESGNVSDYTRDGQLLGHLVRGITLLNRAAERTGVTGETVILLEHMLLSHHGETEYGSPRPPMFPEAEALHWIDMMDARMNTMKTAWEKTPEGAFSERISSLDRRIYHPWYTDGAE
ncbi:MAG: HD domain-containing protein [Clostridiales bacterium]|nr:HD domain-containing protein [Clostridiales bacterium]